jgi:hypothetical protein
MRQVIIRVLLCDKTYPEYLLLQPQGLQVTYNVLVSLLNVFNGHLRPIN